MGMCMCMCICVQQTLCVLVQVGALIKQIMSSSTASAVSRISIMTIGMQGRELMQPTGSMMPFLSLSELTTFLGCRLIASGCPRECLCHATDHMCACIVALPCMCLCLMFRLCGALCLSLLFAQRSWTATFAWCICWRASCGRSCSIPLPRLVSRNSFCSASWRCD